MLFAKSNKTYFQDPWIHISKLLLVDIYQAKSATQDRVKFAELLRQGFTFLEKPNFKSAKHTQEGNPMNESQFEKIQFNIYLVTNMHVNIF